MDRQQALIEWEKQQCTLCAPNFESGRVINFVPTCHAHSENVHKNGMNSLCTFKPQFQHHCRFFKPKDGVEHK